MEKHGRLLYCIQEIKQMLQTPIKPYTKPEATGEGDGEKEREGKKAERSLRRRSEIRREDRLPEEEETAASGDEDGELQQQPTP